MIFTYQKWEQFCRKISVEGVFSTTARTVTEAKQTAPYLILKHDVETNVKKAYNIAKIEKKYEHKGSYYVQAYLLNNSKNVRLLQEMQQMGHEISYHYDVLDACKGCILDARREFAQNIDLFRKNGFAVVTVCQHGNPVIERNGYTSNRDFFRNETVQNEYPDMSDLMVDFKRKANTEYTYYSDAGRKFQMIFDPLNNDIVKSDDKNIGYEGLDEILKQTKILKENSIISIHPHRWTNSKFSYILKAGAFKAIRSTTKLLIKFSFIKKVMSKFYHLAKRI